MICQSYQLHLVPHHSHFQTVQKTGIRLKMMSNYGINRNRPGIGFPTFKVCQYILIINKLIQFFRLHHQPSNFVFCVDNSVGKSA